MLLTLKQPAQQCFNKPFHDYSPPTPPATSRFSPSVAPTGYLFTQPLPVSSSTQSMATPHRGLPPPAAMNLPPPTQSNPPMGQSLPLNPPMGQLPAPPVQWQGAEESMRNWLFAKAEEDKRKQEEEKTRQETLRLEQRKIEQEMLRTSLAGGIPPYMVPMVFAGMGGGNLPNASLEWAQHYVYQQQQQQQQQNQQQQMVQQPSSPEARRESRVPPYPYAPASQQAPGPILQSAGGSTSTSGPPSSSFTPGYQMSPITRSRQPQSISRPPQSSHLPRINTEEMNTQQASQTLPGMQVLPGQPAHLLQQAQSVQQQQQPQPQESQPSPSIYFHHWQPPASQAPAASTTQPISPDSISSPRKRKATGPQQGAPPPPSQYTSPPTSQGGSSISNTPLGRRRGHSRQRSDVSTGRGQEGFGRSGSRHRQTESGGSTSTTVPQQSTYSLPPPQEGISMQPAISFSQSQQPRLSQERYDIRQQPAPTDPRRYSSGPTDARLEEQRRTTPPDRGEMQRPPPPPPPETTQPPR